MKAYGAVLSSVVCFEWSVGAFIEPRDRLRTKFAQGIRPLREILFPAGCYQRLEQRIRQKRVHTISIRDPRRSGQEEPYGDPADDRRQWLYAFFKCLQTD